MDGSAALASFSTRLAVQESAIDKRVPSSRRFIPRTCVSHPRTPDALLAKLVGRSLAHELGHVLLNSLDHGKSGLMRADFGADDALRDLPSSYRLSARELEGLFAGD